MTKPIILTVDDDRDVLQAIARDLRQGFGEHFRIIRAESGERALEVLRQIRLANDKVALMLVDQRMPGLSGVELLVEARKLFPEAKKALLTAYADTEAAITAINEVQLDHYLVKPWDPPEQRLFPVLDDLLDDWVADHPPSFEGVRIIGHRWSPESHAARDFLARNQVPYRWLDVTADAEARELLAIAGKDEGAGDCPVLILSDGTVLDRPSLEEIAEKLGLRGRAEVPVYDLVIIGAGPAGLAAAVYGASEGLSTVLVEREAAGGQAGQSSRIENYLGFPAGLSGGDLSRRAMIQARRFGTELLLTHDAVSLDDHNGVIGVTLKDGSELRGHSAIIATGVSYRRLNVPGIDRLTGRGVYYGAATSETSSVRGEDVYIVGGANSAGQAALHFATVARSVTLLVRGPALSAGMSHYLAERILHVPNVRVRLGVQVAEVKGEEHLESVLIRDSDGRCETVTTSALFVFIGAQPRTDWLDGRVERDDRGFIRTGPDVTPAAWKRIAPAERDPYLLETSIPGVFAAGDVRHGSGKRVATAVGEGATAVISVWQYRAKLGM